MAGLLKPVIQFFLEHEGEETAEHMTSDGCISVMEDGPCIKNRFHIPEDLLYLLEFLVFEGRLLGSQYRVCYKHPLPVESCLMLNLLFVERNGTMIHGEILPVALVSNKGFGVACKLLPQGAVINHNFFDLERRRIFGGYALRADLPVTTGTGRNLFLDLFYHSHPGTQDIGDMFLFQIGHRFLADHPPVGDYAELPVGETSSQPVHYGNKTLDIRSISRPHL